MMVKWFINERVGSFEKGFDLVLNFGCDLVIRGFLGEFVRGCFSFF